MFLKLHWYTKQIKKNNALLQKKRKPTREAKVENMMSSKGWIIPILYNVLICNYLH